ncbi:MAG: hypothetical protein ACTTKO_07615 [Candidatus Limimorpha sp.]
MKTLFRIVTMLLVVSTVSFAQPNYPNGTNRNDGKIGEAYLSKP